MKKLLALCLSLAAFSAFAETITVYQTRISSIGGNLSVDESFQMDEDTKQGYVRVNVSETRYEYDPFPGPMGCDQWGRCYPGGYNRMPVPRTYSVLNDTVKVNGLVLNGEKVLFEGREGTVECGHMGYTRVLRRRAIFLSGNCNLSSYISNNGTLTVSLKTK
jgi:hypothetical protein